MRLLTLSRDLMRRKARERNGLFVAEGIRAVEELLASPLRITGALACDQLLERTHRGVALAAALEQRGIGMERVNERDFLSASDTEHPQGVLAIAEQPAYNLSSLMGSAGTGGTGGTNAAPAVRLLILDGIQDPGNVGTLLRTAAALGCAASIALPGTVDVWNAKVVRSAAGMQFRHPTTSTTGEELEPFLREQAIVLWGADASGDSIDGLSSEPPTRLALAVGNEGAGISEVLRASCARMVSLPMAPGAESLNVAVAAGIALFALRPRQAPAPLHSSR
jgi:TrmH family RNA methyltransferase